MAHFRGTVQGARGQVSRLGTKNSGMKVEAQSWQGKIVVCLEHNAKTGIDNATITFQPHHGNGVSQHIYHGPVGGMPEVPTVPQPREMWRSIEDGSLHETLPAGIHPVTQQPQYEKVLVYRRQSHG